MIKVNIVYEYQYDCVDIISLPDSLSDKIEDINMEFGGFLSPDKDDEDYWIKKNDGSYELLIGTKGLVKWINKYYAKNGEKAVIEKQNVCYNPRYPSMDF